MAEIDMDSLQKLEELLAGSENPENPSRADVLKLVETADLSDEVRENLRSMLKGNVPEVFGSYGSGAMLAVFFVCLIFSIILFFGYKLYKSIKEKEKKKEEKKKAKQMKKKK